MSATCAAGTAGRNGSVSTLTPKRGGVVASRFTPRSRYSFRAAKASPAPDRYMDEWFRAAPPHHFALSVGKNAGIFVRIARLLGVEGVVIG